MVLDASAGKEMQGQFWSTMGSPAPPVAAPVTTDRFQFFETR